MKPPQFELSADTRFLRQKLHEMKPGDFISYAALSELISKDVTGATSALASAKRGLLKEGYVFGTVRGEGVKLLVEVDTLKAADMGLQSVRRRSRMEAKKLSTVSADKLPANMQNAFTAKLSIFGAIASFATDKAVAAIEKTAGGRAGELPIKDTMRALGYVK